MWTQIRLSDQNPQCFPIRKNRFEKFARIFSRRHKQTTFSDAGFLGILRVKVSINSQTKISIDLTYNVNDDIIFFFYFKTVLHKKQNFYKSLEIMFVAIINLHIFRTFFH